MLDDLHLFKAGLASRPSAPFNEGYVQDRPGPIERDEYEVQLEELYELSKRCNAVRKSVQALRDTILMNGYEWEPKYSRKCKVCREEYPPDEKPDFCKECGAHTAEEEQAPPGPQPMGGGPEEGPLGHGPGPQPAQPEPAPEAESDEPQPEPGEAPPPEEQDAPVDTSVGVRFPPDTEWYEEPDEREVEAMDDFFKKVDRNGNTFLESLKIYEDHLNISDDSFFVHLADYDLDQGGGIHDWTTRELYVADPRNFRMVQHPKLQTPGGRWWICLKHRPTPDVSYLYGSEAPQENRSGNASSRTAADDAYSHPSPHAPPGLSGQGEGRVYEEPGECEECGRKLHEVWWVAIEPGTGHTTSGSYGAGEGDETIIEYYVGPDPESGFPGEVIHQSKYSPSYGYGKAPLTSVYNMARTLIEQERFMRTFYEEERMPRSALFIPTRSADQVKSLWKSAEDRNVSQDGHYVPKFTFDPGDSSAMPQYMEFSRLPEEMQFEQVRDEFYRRIGSAFDVAPVFHGNVDAVGLQNQGPTQWQVTLMGAKKGQSVYNENVFPQLLDLVKLECPECGHGDASHSGVGPIHQGDECDLCEGEGKITVEDWELELKPVELEDETQELQKEMMRVQRAMSMQQIGFPPLGRDPVTGEFEFPVEPQEELQGQGGGGGGMMGGPPSSPPSQGGGQGGQGGGMGGGLNPSGGQSGRGGRGGR